MNLIRRVFLLLAVSILALSLAGCSELRANNSVKKTSEMLQQMEDLRGQEHRPEQMESIRNRINEANSQIQADQASQALRTAKDAQQQAETLLIEIKGEESRELYEQAQDEIQIADLNGINIQKPDLYQQIIDLQDQASQARDEQKYDDVISRSREIISLAQRGLADAQSAGQRAREEAEASLTELKAIGGQEYDPEAVIAVTDKIQQATDSFEDQRNYVLAANQFRDARVESERGIENVRRLQANEQIDEIEQLLAEARGEGAPEFLPEEFEGIIKSLDSLIADFAETRYQRVKLGATELLPRVEALVLNTKRRAADARIETIRRDLQELEEGGARAYLAEPMDRLQQFLTEAQRVRAADNEEAFDEVKGIARDAADEADKINRAFDDLAAEAIRLAGGRLETVNEVYGRVPRIFPATAEGVEASPFDTNRDVRYTQIGEELAAARENLAVAAQRQRNARYRSAILLAEDQAAKANTLLGEVYRLVAQNAVIELSNLISRYERDGAREYSTQELERSRRDLQRVKDAINQENHLLATELAAAARANIELMAQRISGRAVEAVREARQASESARNAKTERFSGELLQQVDTLIEEANQALQEENLKTALETAQQATQLASQAEQQANRLAAEESIEKASATITRAETAQADLYAGEMIEAAKNLLASARELQANNDFAQAERLASSSVERAEQGLYRKINDAEAAIADAKSVGGWDYRTSDLAQASSLARQSREQLLAEDFRRSATMADRATSLARSVANATRDNNFAQTVARIQQNLNVGQDQGINYFQVEDSVEIRRELTNLQNNYNLDRYDEIMAELQNLEGRLRETLDETDDIVTTVAEQQSRRLEYLVERGAADFGAEQIGMARRNLRIAREDYERGFYKPAHSALDTAIKSIDEIEARYLQELYTDRMRGILQGYDVAQAGFSNYLRLGPVEMKELAFGSYARGNAIAIASQLTPMEFRREVERVYSQALDIVPPPNMVTAHKNILTALNLGRIAAIHFEKMIILDLASRQEAENLIDTAYARMNESNRILASIKQDFFQDEVRFRLVTAEADLLGQQAQR